MRILTLLLDNTLGGPQKRVLNSNKILNLKGISQVAGFPNKEGRAYDEFIKEGIKSYKIPLYRPRKIKDLSTLIENIFLPFSILISCFVIVLILIKEKIDIIHINGMLGIHAIIPSLITNKPAIWHLMGTLYPSWLVKFTIPLILNFSNKIIFISNDSLYFYTNKNQRKKYKQKLSIIYEGVPEIKNEKNTKNINFKNKAVIGTIGNISEVKGHEYLIKAFNLLQNKYGACKLFIVGGVRKSQKDYFTYLKSLVKKYNIENKVIFTGFVNNPISLLEQFDIFVMSSLSEGTPLTILESMSKKVPVISTNVGGINEQIIEGESGVLVPEKNVSILYNKMHMLLNNRRLRHRLSKNAYNRYKKYFTIKSYGEKFSNILFNIKN